MNTPEPPNDPNTDILTWKLLVIQSRRRTPGIHASPSQITNIWNICDICFWLDADQPQMYMLSKPWLFGKGRFAVGIHEHQLVSSSKDGPGCRVLLSGLDLEDPFHQIARQNETKHHILCDLTGLPLRVGFNAPQWDRIDDMERYGTDPKLVMGCHTLPQ